MVLFLIMGLCLGVVFVDIVILLILGYFVDLRYVLIYGSVYVIVDIFYFVVYVFGFVMVG